MVQDWELGVNDDELTCSGCVASYIYSMDETIHLLGQEHVPMSLTPSTNSGIQILVPFPTHRASPSLMMLKVYFSPPKSSKMARVSPIGISGIRGRVSHPGLPDVSGEACGDSQASAVYPDAGSIRHHGRE